MLRVGATGFGGPMALIGMLQDHFVERRKAVTPEVFSEGVAIGQVLPGPIAVDAAIHMGYRLWGWLGAMAGAVGLVLPPFLLMLVITPLYFHFGNQVHEVQGFFAGVRPAVVAVIAAAALRMGKKGLKGGREYIIAAVIFAGMLLRANAILLVVLSALLGLLLCQPDEPKQPAAEEAEEPEPAEAEAAPAEGGES